MGEKKNGFLLHSVLKSVLASLVLTGLSLLSVAVIYLNKDLSDDAARNIVTVCALASVFISVAAAGIKLKNSGLLLGLFSGVLYALCLYITGFIAFGFPGFSKGLLSTLALSVLSGASGGIVGVNIKGKKK